MNALHQNVHNNNDNDNDNDNNAPTVSKAPKRQQVSMAVNAAIVDDDSENKNMNISSAYRFVDGGRWQSSLSQQQC